MTFGPAIIFCCLDDELAVDDHFIPLMKLFPYIRLIEENQLYPAGIILQDALNHGSAAYSQHIDTRRYVSFDICHVILNKLIDSLDTTH